MGKARRRPQAARAIPGDRVREIRQGLHLSASELARLLTCGVATISRAEKHGAPRWMVLALGGLAVARYGLSVTETARLLGTTLDGGPFQPETEEERAKLTPMDVALRCLPPLTARQRTRRKSRTASGDA